jgi:hypothetical protein
MDLVVMACQITATREAVCEWARVDSAARCSGLWCPHWDADVLEPLGLNLDFITHHLEWKSYQNSIFNFSLTMAFYFKIPT